MSGHVPHEFSSVSVSAYESATLSALLQERSADGWTVVSIVPAGTSVVAYLSRPTSGTTATATAATVNPEPVTTTPAAGGAGWALQPESATSSPSTQTAAESATTSSSTAASSTAAASSGAAPAGWYADPSGRFELRYWDGGRWTEHVSRGGNQYTDPPVA